MHKVSWTHHPKATDFHIIWGYFLFNSWDASWFSGSFQICMWNYLNHKRKKGMNHETSSFFLGGGYTLSKKQNRHLFGFQAFESNPTQQLCCSATRQIQAVKNAIDSYRHSPPGVKPSEWTSLMVIFENYHTRWAVAFVFFKRTTWSDDPTWLIML